MNQHTKQCPFCAENIPANAAVCPFCAETLTQTPLPPQPQLYVGNPQQIQQPEAPYTPPPEPPRKRNLKVIIGGVVAAIVLIGGGIGGFSYYKNSQKEGGCGDKDVIETASGAFRDGAKEKSKKIAESLGYTTEWKAEAVDAVLDKIKFQYSKIEQIADNESEGKLYCKANTKVSIPKDVWEQVAQAENALAAANGRDKSLSADGAMKLISQKTGQKIVDGNLVFDKPLPFWAQRKGDRTSVTIQGDVYGVTRDALAHIATNVAMKNAYVANIMERK